MGDSLTTIIAIFLAALLMFIFPLTAISELNDDTSQMYVKTILDNFVNGIIAKGTLTKEDYENLQAQLEATNNSYGIELVISVADVNPGKKENSAETTYYSIYTNQIIEILQKEEGIYYLKEGDYFKVAAKNQNSTISQMIKNVLFGITGNESYVIEAAASGVVVTTGH